LGRSDLSLWMKTTLRYKTLEWSKYLNRLVLLRMVIINLKMNKILRAGVDFAGNIA
jgi:hypothetical protein